jgi:hypothetical protein
VAKAKRARGVAYMMECLLNNREALSLNPNEAKNKNK